MLQDAISFISVMAAPSMSCSWEKLLMPAFVYFFKVLYPFCRVNSHRANVAAAAGGCILIEEQAAGSNRWVCMDQVSRDRRLHFGQAGQVTGI